jgi:hypothetical protein
MTRKRNGWDGITNGTVVTIGNSGGSSGDALDVATVGASATLISDNTHVDHGTQALKVATGATSTTAIVGWTSLSGGTMAASIWMFIPSFASASTSTMAFRFRNGSSATGLRDDGHSPYARRG